MVTGICPFVDWENGIYSTKTGIGVRNVRFGNWDLDQSSGEGGTLGISGWECAARTLEPLAYAELVSAGFCFPILE